jgi:copper chaperone
MSNYLVDGMTCGGCAASVTKAIEGAIPGTKVEVNLEAKRVTVSPDVEEAVIRQLVEDAGFTFNGAV